MHVRKLPRDCRGAHYKGAPTGPDFADTDLRDPLDGYFLLRALPRAPFDLGAEIAKSSILPPPLSAAASQRGLSPLPAQVSEGFSGLRYFAATGPPRRPVIFFRRS
jgi:hypothetical protein